MHFLKYNGHSDDVQMVQFVLGQAEISEKNISLMEIISISLVFFSIAKLNLRTLDNSLLQIVMDIQ